MTNTVNNMRRLMAALMVAMAIIVTQNTAHAACDDKLPQLPDLNGMEVEQMTSTMASAGLIKEHPFCACRKSALDATGKIKRARDFANHARGDRSSYEWRLEESFKIQCGLRLRDGGGIVGTTVEGAKKAKDEAGKLMESPKSYILRLLGFIFNPLQYSFTTWLCMILWFRGLWLIWVVRSNKSEFMVGATITISITAYIGGLLHQVIAFFSSDAAMAFPFFFPSVCVWILGLFLTWREVLDFYRWLWSLVRRDHSNRTVQLPGARVVPPGSGVRSKAGPQPPADLATPGATPVDNVATTSPPTPDPTSAGEAAQSAQPAARSTPPMSIPDGYITHLGIGRRRRF